MDESANRWNTALSEWTSRCIPLNSRRDFCYYRRSLAAPLLSVGAACALSERVKLARKALGFRRIRVKK